MNNQSNTQNLTVEEQIDIMKQWCVDNYENGADTMVECWEDDQYRQLITDYRGDFKDAMDLLKDIAEAYLDQIAEAQQYEDGSTIDIMDGY